MRYMMLVRSVAPAGPPPSAFLEAMGKLSAQGRESGMLIAGGPRARDAAQRSVRSSTPDFLYMPFREATFSEPEDARVESWNPLPL
jgi:hypothetical protein